MAEENGIPTVHEATSSQSPAEMEEEEKKDISKVSDNKGQAEKANTVPFLKLFSFADSTDILLMIVGTIAAIGNGVSMPLMSLLMGEMVNSFGSNQSDDEIVKTVSKVSKQKLYTKCCLNLLLMLILFLQLCSSGLSEIRVLSCGSWSCLLSP